MFEVEPIQALEQQNRHFILHLIQTQGKGRTIEKIKASSKQVVKAPTTYLELIQQLKFFSGLCNIFFGKHSTATCSLVSLIEVVKRNKTTFKTNEIREEFTSQFLFAVNKRMQMWFESITMATSRYDIDDSPLNFTSLIDFVKFGHFFQLLPPAFTKKNKFKKRPGLLRDVEEGPTHNDKKKLKDNCERNKSIINTSHFPESKLLQGKTWASNFAGKKEGSIQWEGQTIMCPRWFITGRCFDNCFNVASHVKKEDAPKAKLIAFANYMKTCRGK
jgi:hypothetical protein